MRHNPHFHLPIGERQLFLDEDDVDQVVGLQKIFHPAEKKGPVIRRIPAIGGYPEIRTAPASLWGLTPPSSSIARRICRSLLF